MVGIFKYYNNISKIAIYTKVNRDTVEKGYKSCTYKIGNYGN